jgi:hypothetical protein
MAAFAQVHNGQAPVPEATIAETENTFAIRATTGMQPIHFHDRLYIGKLSVKTYLSRKSAHEEAPYPK